LSAVQRAHFTFSNMAPVVFEAIRCRVVHACPIMAGQLAYREQILSGPPFHAFEWNLIPYGP
ncbi:MAG: hypothetical protein AAGK30_04495, partial [Pseudomonadota bacterium]